MTDVYISATKDCAGTVTTTVLNKSGDGITFAVTLGPVPYSQGPFHLADGKSVTLTFENASGELSYGFVGTPKLDDGRLAHIHGGGALPTPIDCATTTIRTTTSTTPSTTIATTTTTTTPTSSSSTTPSTTIATTSTSRTITTLPHTGTNGQAVAGIGGIAVCFGLIAVAFGRKVRHHGQMDS